jgi:hypothetical protein
MLLYFNQENLYENICFFNIRSFKFVPEIASKERF